MRTVLKLVEHQVIRTYVIDFFNKMYLNMYVAVYVTLIFCVVVFFNDSTYNVVERNGYVQPVLVLSKPSSTDITVQVINIDGTATGLLDVRILLMLIISVRI